jgi:hypothetical protein
MKITKEEAKMAVALMGTHEYTCGNLNICHVIQAYRLGKKAQQVSARRIARRTSRSWAAPARL